MIEETYRLRSTPSLFSGEAIPSQLNPGSSHKQRREISPEAVSAFATKVLSMSHTTGRLILSAITINRSSCAAKRGQQLVLLLCCNARR